LPLIATPAVVSDKPDTLGILLASGTHERVHYAFVLASAAAALGREVVLFATNRGCLGLCTDWSGLDGMDRDTTVRNRGVAGLATLREACVELDVRMIACEAGLRAEAVEQSALMPEVEVAGVATFLTAVKAGQIITI
jgi:uncharacterized protein